MTSAISEIKATYDYEDAKEIVNNGCESGLCFKHIYYDDTVGFFNKYPDEITRYIVDNAGIDYLKKTLERHDGWLDGYLNDLVWAFIELVCGEIVDDHESTTCEEMDDEPIKLYADYSKEDLELLRKHGYNPQRSMTDSRYSQV
jgi:hypothetical protein